MQFYLFDTLALPYIIIYSVLGIILPLRSYSTGTNEMIMRLCFSFAICVATICFNNDEREKACDSPLANKSQNAVQFGY